MSGWYEPVLSTSNSRKPVEEWCERNNVDQEDYWYREQLMVPWQTDHDGKGESVEEELVFAPDEIYVSRYKCPTRNRRYMMVRDEEDGDTDDEYDLYDAHDDCDQLPTSLLLICKQIYHEALPLLYSENKFQISLSDWNNLYSLEFLGEKPISLIRFLTIRIPYDLEWLGQLTQALCMAEDLDRNDLHLGIIFNA